jgi:hypothetical protein
LRTEEIEDENTEKNTENKNKNKIRHESEGHFTEAEKLQFAAAKVEFEG